jgi:hypothetical protein
MKTGMWNLISVNLHITFYENPFSCSRVVYVKLIGEFWDLFYGMRRKCWRSPKSSQKSYTIFFTVVPCILISSKSFIHQQMHYLLILENSKIDMKTYIKIAPTCFGPRPSSGSLYLSLAKITLMLKQSVKLCRYVLCSGVWQHVMSATPPHNT